MERCVGMGGYHFVSSAKNILRYCCRAGRNRPLVTFLIVGIFDDGGHDYIVAPNRGLRDSARMECSNGGDWRTEYEGYLLAIDQ